MSESPTTAPRALERTKVTPILFSGPMVRAILEGRKTQTRRILKLPNSKGESRRGEWEASTVGGPGVMSAAGEPFPERACVWHPKAGTIVVPPYKPGDLLWVRETWSAVGDGVWTIADARRQISPRQKIEYAADGGVGPWWPSIHMPREFSRLTLEVTAVKVERLQEISEEDAKAEGIKMEFAGIGLAMWKWSDDPNVPCATTPQGAFVKLWDHLNAKRGYGWEANPWVCAIAFNVHKMNVDAFLAQREAA